VGAGISHFIERPLLLYSQSQMQNYVLSIALITIRSCEGVPC
jgi:hypothetical protein